MEGRRRGPGAYGPRWFISGPPISLIEGAGAGITNEKSI